MHRLNNKENCINVPRGPQTLRYHISAGRRYEQKNAVKGRLGHMETRNCCFSLFLSLGLFRLSLRLWTPEANIRAVYQSVAFTSTCRN